MSFRYRVKRFYYYLLIETRNVATVGAIAMIGSGAFGCSEKRSTRRSEPLPRLALFDSAATADDSLPFTASSTLSEAGRRAIQHPGARRVAVGIDPTWLVPLIDGRLCLVQLVYPIVVTDTRTAAPITSITCASESETVAGNLIVADSLMAEVRTHERSLIIGIVPNGVPRVEVRETDGRVSIIRVTRNAYEALVGRPKSVEFVYGITHHIVRVQSFSGKGHYQAPTKEPF